MERSGTPAYERRTFSAIFLVRSNRNHGTTVHDFTAGNDAHGMRSLGTLSELEVAIRARGVISVQSDNVEVISGTLHTDRIVILVTRNNLERRIGIHEHEARHEELDFGNF
jgi:hypothetical protein